MISTARPAVAPMAGRHFEVFQAGPAVRPYELDYYFDAFLQEPSRGRAEGLLWLYLSPDCVL